MILVSAAVALTLYLFFLPMFWWRMPITAQANIGTRWPHNADMPVHVIVTGWHRNFEVRQVRFTPLAQTMTGLGPEYYPVVAYERPPRRYWMRWRINLLTFPHRDSMDVVVPFEQLAREGRSKPGARVGRLEVQVEYIDGLFRYDGWYVPTTRETILIPFQLELE
jgi:hypothetical protein